MALMVALMVVVPTCPVEVLPGVVRQIFSCRGWVGRRAGVGQRRKWRWQNLDDFEREGAVRTGEVQVILLWGAAAILVVDRKGVGQKEEGRMGVGQAADLVAQAWCW